MKCHVLEIKDEIQHNDGEDLSIFDWTEAGIALLGMGVIVFGWTAKE